MTLVGVCFGVVPRLYDLVVNTWFWCRADCGLCVSWVLVVGFDGYLVFALLRVGRHSFGVC